MTFSNRNNIQFVFTYLNGNKPNGRIYQYFEFIDKNDFQFSFYPRGISSYVVFQNGVGRYGLGHKIGEKTHKNIQQSPTFN